MEMFYNIDIFLDVFNQIFDFVSSTLMSIIDSMSTINIAKKSSDIRDFILNVEYTERGICYLLYWGNNKFEVVHVTYWFIGTVTTVFTISSILYFRKIFAKSLVIDTMRPDAGTKSRADRMAHEIKLNMIKGFFQEQWWLREKFLIIAWKVTSGVSRMFFTSIVTGLMGAIGFLGFPDLFHVTNVFDIIGNLLDNGTINKDHIPHIIEAYQNFLNKEPAAIPLSIESADISKIPGFEHLSDKPAETQGPEQKDVDQKARAGDKTVDVILFALSIALVTGSSGPLWPAIYYVLQADPFYPAQCMAGVFDEIHLRFPGIQVPDFFPRIDLSSDSSSSSSSSGSSSPSSGSGGSGGSGVTTNASPLSPPSPQSPFRNLIERSNSPGLIRDQDPFAQERR